MISGIKNALKLWTYGSVSGFNQKLKKAYAKGLRHKVAEMTTRTCMHRCTLGDTTLKIVMMGPVAKKLKMTSYLFFKKNLRIILFVDGRKQVQAKRSFEHY